MKRNRLIGILWVLAGLVLLAFAYRTDPRNTVYFVLGIAFVALGAALVRRSGRS